MTRFPWRTYTRPVFVQIAIITLVLFAAGLATHVKLKERFLEQIKEQLQDSATLLVAEDFSHIDENYCHERARDTPLRLSIIDSRGRVVCDSQHEAVSMDNHAGRPEVATALDHGSGSSIRHSDTLRTDLMYVAAKTVDGAFIVRVAEPLQRLDHSLALLEQMLWLVLVLVILILSLFAMWTGRVLLIPLAHILRKAQSVLLEPSRKG